MDKELLLHIGMGKTGTSALQSFFAKNTSALLEAGIYYPELLSLENAAKGGVGAGNGAQLAKALLSDHPNFPDGTEISADRAADELSPHLMQAHPQVLISSERLMHFDPELLDRFVERVSTFGYRTQIICFVRNPAEQHFSAYLQGVKVQSETRSYHEFLADNEPEKFFVAHLIGKLQTLTSSNLSYRVFNYADSKSDVVDFFLRKIINRKDLAQRLAFDKRVNRSISPRETEFLRMINGLFERNSHKEISDGLLKASPELAVSNTPDYEDQQRLVEAIKPILPLINSKIEGTKVLATEGSDQNDEDDFNTLLRIMAVYFHFLDQSMNKLHQEIKQLSNSPNETRGNSSDDSVEASEPGQSVKNSINTEEVKPNEQLQRAFHHPWLNLVDSFRYRIAMARANKPNLPDAIRKKRLERAMRIRPY